MNYFCIQIVEISNVVNEIDSRFEPSGYLGTTGCRSRYHGGMSKSYRDGQKGPCGWLAPHDKVTCKKQKTANVLRKRWRMMWLVALEGVPHDVQLPRHHGRGSTANASLDALAPAIPRSTKYGCAR